MKLYEAEVGFIRSGTDRIERKKYFRIKAHDIEEAGMYVCNGLYMQEYEHFKILKITELRNGKVR